MSDMGMNYGADAWKKKDLRLKTNMIRHQGLEHRTMEDVASMPIEIQRESLFRLFVIDQMLDQFEEDLADADIESDVVARIVSPSAKTSFEVLYRAMAFPYDLRATLFSRIKAKIDTGELQPEDVIGHLAELAVKNKFSIGFHMSPSEIKQGAKGWGVNGTERDHRDDDLPMAYFSRTFATLYKKGQQNYMYVVRCMDDDRNDGNWWRAPSLSIIQKIPTDKLWKAMHQLETELNDRRKEAA